MRVIVNEDDGMLDGEKLLRDEGVHFLSLYLI